MSQVLQCIWPPARGVLIDFELFVVGDGNPHAIPICVFPSTHFSLKPVDIPSFLCCCNANLSAPLKKKETGGGGGITQSEGHSTALRINHVHCIQWTEILSCAQLRKWEWEHKPIICVFPSNKSHLDWKRDGEKRDRRIVLHLQYVSELVAMQQDWESVEEGDGKLGTV